MELLLLKSSACLLALLLFYKLTLESLSIHKFKRVYLIIAVVVAAIIPLITFIKYIDPTFNVDYLNTFHSDSLLIPIENEILVEEPVNYLPTILWSIYALGASLFFIRFCVNLFGMVSKIRNHTKVKRNRFVNVLMEQLEVPHTFFNFIFLNKNKFENNQIPAEVLLHEQTHAKQKHSLDIIVIELLQIVFWFNPLLYWLKKEVKLNHEFLADEAVLNQGIDTKNYQNILLQFSSNQQDVALANAINYSSIKKRFTLMKTQTSKQTAWLRSLLLLPLLAVLLFSFSQTKEVEKELVPKMEIDSNDVSSTKHTARSIDIEVFRNGTYEIDGIKATKSTFKQIINLLHQDITAEIRNNIINIHVDSPKDISNKEVWFIYNAVQDYGFHRILAYNQEVIRSKGNTPFALEDEEEKNSLAEALNNSIKKINAQIMYTTDKEEYYKNATIVFRDKNKKVIKSVKFSELSEREKRLLPTPPSRPMKNNPTKSQLNNWLDSKKYGVWLDGKRIKNNTLNNYSSSSFVHYFESRLAKNAVNYGKHYYQVNLHTEAGYNKVWKDALNPLGKDAKIYLYYNEKALSQTKKNKANYSYTATYTEDPKLLVNGKECDKCQLILTKEEFINLKLGTNTNEKITSFNFKVPGYPTVNVKGNKLNSKAIEYLKKGKNNDVFQIFHIQTKENLIDSHIRVSIQENSGEAIPPPPPPVSPNATPEQKAKQEKVIKEYKEWAKVRKGEDSQVPPPPPPAPKVEKSDIRAKHEDKRSEMMAKRQEKMKDRKDKRAELNSKLEERKAAIKERREKMQMQDVPRPPKPKAPIDHIVDMAKKGASFYYNGDPITSDKAIELVKKNKGLNISSNSNNGVSTVHLSEKGIKTVNGKVVED